MTQQEEFHKLSLNLVTWEECQGLMCDKRVWIPKEEVTLEEALHLVKDYGCVAIPF